MVLLIRMRKVVVLVVVRRRWSGDSLLHLCGMTGGSEVGDAAWIWWL